MRKMKILITGGAGFIASHIADAFIEEGHDVAIIDNLSTGRKENINDKATFFEGSITDRSFLEKVISEFHPEVLDHHAAHIHVGNSVKDPLFDEKTNIHGTILLMEALIRNASLKKVIFASTGGAMYGEKQTPFSEELMPSPLSPYGVSKRSAELYLGFYSHQYGIKVTNLRYANVYGPRQNPHGEAGVVSIFSQFILANKQPIINGDGLQTRDYVFVEDVVNANLKALNNPTSGTFNIGTAKETTVNEVFRLVNQNFGTKWPEVHGPKRAGEQQTSSLSYKRAEKQLEWKPKTSIEDGIKKTVNWFKNNLNRV